MTYKVNTLQMAAWALPALDDTIPLTIFRMDAPSYSMLVDWTRAKTGRDEPGATAIIRGLHEVASLFVPDVAYVSTRAGGLEMTFLGNVEDDQDQRSRLRVALATWLGTVYAEGTSPPQRAAVADAAMRDTNWTVEEVHTGLRGRGGNACDEPNDRRLWDALTARVVRALAGKSVTFDNGLTKRMIPTVPTAGPYDGIELVAFPPDLSSRRGGGYYSEVITICTANLPERDGIYILAHTSIRNWGEVRSATRRDAHRSLDVFIPQMPDLEYLGSQRHGAFSMKVVLDGERGAQRRPCVGRWQHREDEDIFGTISRLTGFDGLSVKKGLTPLSTPDGVWVLPRLGSFHGDKYLPGGTGRSMKDQQALVEAVGQSVEALGLERLPAVSRRVTKQAKPEAPFVEETPEDLASRRAMLAKAIRAVNGESASGDFLDLFLFARRDAAAADLRTAVRDVLGQPQETGDLMHWEDGLSVRLHVHAAGHLAEALASWEEPTDEDRMEFRTNSEWNAEQRRRRDEANKTARRKMEEWVRAARHGVAGACCAILEIPEEFRGSTRDPFLMAKQVLAAERIIPQVVLVKADAPIPQSSGAEDGDEEDNTPHRFGRAFADLLRALGVVPTSDDDGQGLAALTVAQVNSAWQSGMRIESQAVPLAAQVRGGVL